MPVQRVVFGEVANQVFHTFRHIDQLGLPRDEVIATILGDLHQVLDLAGGGPLDTLLIRTVSLRGILLTYHAYPVSETVVNVGRITSP